MKINFEELKENLINALDEDEDDYDEDEVLECIEKLKGLPYGIFKATEVYFFERLHEVIFEEFDEDEELLEQYFREAHPDFPEDEDVTEDDDYFDFCNSLTDEVSLACKIESFDNAKLNVQEEVRKNVTQDVADFFDLHLYIVGTNANALPYHDFQIGEDESTSEEIKAEYLAWVQTNHAYLKFVPDLIREKVAKEAGIKEDDEGNANGRN